jgi:hypothetical protein
MTIRADYDISSVNAIEREGRPRRLSTKVFRFGLLVVALTCFAASPGFCGHWQVGYETDGENYSNTNGTQHWPNPVTYTAMFQSATGNRQASSIGSVTPVLQWMPDFEGDTELPPAKVYTMAYATAKAGPKTNQMAR